MDSYATLSMLLSSAVIFIILSHPCCYKISNKKLQEYDVVIANEEGCPYALGVLLHGILFMLLLSVVISTNCIYSITMISLLIFFGIILWS